MHPERALRVINLLDIPENKRKFWPQQCAIVVRDSTREIVDVIQFFSNSFTESEQYAQLYPGCTTFFNSTGDFQTVGDLQAKIEWCFKPATDSTYIVGHGLLDKRKSPEPFGRRIMKSISASIIVLAAAILILGGSHLQHGDTGLFVQIAGCIVGVCGLRGWFVSLKEK